MGQGGFRLASDLSAVDHLTVQGDAYDGRIAQPALSHITVSGSNVLGRWSHSLSKTSVFTLQLYVDRNHRNISGTFGDTVNIYEVYHQHLHHDAKRLVVV